MEKLDGEQIYTKKYERIEVFIDFLKKEGYIPRLEEDPDPGRMPNIYFSHHEKEFYISVDEMEDIDFFQLAYIDDLEIIGIIEDEKIKLYHLASEVNLCMNYSKVGVLIKEDNVLLWVGIDTMMEHPSEIKKYFYRLIENIDKTIEYFINRMNNCGDLK